MRSPEWQLPAGPVVRRFIRLANSRRWGVWLSMVTLATLLCLVVIRELEELVRGMQLPGEPSMSLRRLAWDPAGAHEVVGVWRRFGLEAGTDFATARFVASLQMIVDTVFVAGYVTIAAMLLLRDEVRAGLRSAVRASALRRARAAGLGRAASADEADRVAREQSGAYDLALDLTFFGVLALGFVSWMENGLIVKVVRGFWDAFPDAPPGAGWTAAVWALRGAVITKWLLAAIVAVPAVTFVVRFALYKLTTFGAALRLVRVQLLLALAFAGATLLPVQMPDLILRLSGPQFAVVIATTAAFGLVSWAFSRRLVLHAHWRRTNAAPDARRAQIGVVGVGLAVGVFATTARIVTVGGGHAGPVLVPLGLAALVLGAGWVIGEVPERRRRAPDAGVGGDVLPRMMGAGVLAVLGISIVKATTGPMVYALRWGELLRFAWGLGAVAAAAALFAVLHRLDDREENAPWTGWWRGSLRTISIAAAVPVVAFWAMVFVSPWDVPESVSALGVLAVFLTLLGLVTGGMTIAAEWSAERYGVPSLLRLLRLRTIPVLSLLLVWGMVAGRLGGTDHLLVRVRTERPPVTGLTLAEAFERWKDVNTAGIEVPAPTAGTPRPGVPLVLVAAAGGGIRAATWTGLVLDCVFAPVPSQEVCRDDGGDVDARPAGGTRMFLGSGVSGGALGLVTYATQLRERAGATGPPVDWVAQRLSGDYVSPSVAWGLFAEFPRLFLGYPAMDRAEVLERGWERSWGDEGEDSPLGRGFLETQSAAAELGLPYLILNGTSVRDGCLLNTSILEASLDDGAIIGQGPDERRLVGGCHSLEPFAEPSPSGSPLAPANADAVLPGATDLLDFLCSDHDVSMSTAALLSARFPGASPSGRIEACLKENDEGVMHVVDGGYVELSGAETLMAMWPHLDALIDRHNRSASGPCVVPFFVQIDNRYAKPAAPPSSRPPNELLAPAQALRSQVLAPRAQRAEAAAAFAFAKGTDHGVMLDGRPVVDRFANLVPLAHPGITAPLGWTLSDAAQEDLRTQLGEDRNLTEIREIREWLTGDLTCG